MRWRRLCVDVDDSDRVIGGSVEFYDDMERRPTAIHVMPRSQVDKGDFHDALDILNWVAWEQPSLLDGLVYRMGAETF